MSKGLEGKVVLVTGAGAGIGRAVAMCAAREGAKVVVNDLGVSLSGEGGGDGPARQVADEIIAAGGHAVANFGSVSDHEAAQAMVQQAVDAFGRIDGVVNNAGILRDRMFHRMSFEEWKAVIDVHLTGAFNVSRAAATFFKEQGSGAYVHMTSPTGVVGNMGQANYGAAKTGIIGLSKAIALDMAAFNVRSNAVSPSAFTRMLGGIEPKTPEQKARLEDAKLNTPEKIAPFITFLLSDSAKDVTGQIFGVRRNEIMLFSQTRPIRSLAKTDGWDFDSIEATALPALKKFLIPLEGAEYFAWQPL
jgi:NAD(P)-dependent dehydrogenase (short-subunit alcohol dehydrogenase family)